MGWFKLWRELKDKPIWKGSTREQKVVLISLLMMVNYKPNEWEWQGEKFITNPGQFVTSIKGIRKVAGKDISIQNVRSSLARFTKLEFLTCESTKMGRIITILNWGTYQELDDSPTDVVTKTQHRPNIDPTPIKEVKKDKKLKKTTITFHDNQFHGISDDDIIRWSETYPLVKVRVEIMRMESWYETQPSNKWKNKKRGIVNWLGRTQKDNESKPPVDDMPPLFAPPTADELEALKNLK